MNVMDYVKGKRSKTDDLPGTVEAYLDRDCPVCGKKLKQMKACCGSPMGYIRCRDNSCGYRESL